MAAAERGAPNPDRPRLPDADEKRLELLDQRGARAYTSIEAGLEAIRLLFGVDAGGIVVAVVFTDTAVTRIVDVGQKLRGG